jgi:WhiB family redox-sensing transcriptional regulator
MDTGSSPIATRGSSVDCVKHEDVVALMTLGGHDLLGALRRPDWMAHAACRGSSLNVVPSQSTAAKWREVPPALAATCGRCEVRDDCLAVALADSSITGCWGGTGDRQRAELRRRAPAA